MFGGYKANTISSKDICGKQEKDEDKFVIVVIGARLIVNEVLLGGDLACCAGRVQSQPLSVCESEIHLSIVNWGGDEVARVEVLPSDNVLLGQKQIEDQIGVPPHKQRLVHGEQQLEEGGLWSAYGVLDWSTVQLTIILEVSWLQRIDFFMRCDENDAIGYPECLCSSGTGSSPQGSFNYHQRCPSIAPHNHVEFRIFCNGPAWDRTESEVGTKRLL